MKDTKLLWGVAFAVGVPDPLWNARLIYHILVALGGKANPKVQERMREDTEFHYYAIDKDTRHIISYEIDGQRKCEQIFMSDDDKVEREIVCSNYMMISHVVSGINNWILPLQPWRDEDLDASAYTSNTNWHELGKSLTIKEEAQKRFMLLFMSGIAAYEKDHNDHCDADSKVWMETRGSIQSLTQDPYFRPANFITYFDEVYVDIDGTYKAIIQPGCSFPECRCEMSCYDRMIIHTDLKLHRWDEPEFMEDPDPWISRNRMPKYPPVSRIAKEPRWERTPVYGLSITWDGDIDLPIDKDCAGYEDLMRAHAFATFWTNEWFEGLKDEFNSIYNNGAPTDKEVFPKVKQVKTPLVMAETKKSSFMEKMMARFKGQFIPEKCDEFAMAWNGQIVAKCKAGSETIYNAIEDGAVVAYPEEAVMNISMYTILRPAEKIQIDDIICISGATTAARFGKVTKVNKANGKVTGFEVTRFNGTQDGAAVTKDAILKMGLVEVIFNPFADNSEIFEGTDMNPMMFLMFMNKDNSMDPKDMFFMSMMANGKNNPFGGNMNPMMFMFMDKGNSMDIKDMFFMSMMANGKNNPFTDFFKGMTQAQELSKPKGKGKTKPTDTTTVTDETDGPEDGQ